MDLTSSGTKVALAAGSAVAATSLLILSRHRRKRTPPGPPLEPLLGGLRSMPSSYQWITFAEWAQKWGMVISLPSLFVVG